MVRRLLKGLINNVKSLNHHMLNGNSGQNILVTGGAGFIGSHLVDHLLQQGHRVWVIDDFSTGSWANVPVDHNRLTIIAKDLLALTPEDLRHPFQAVAHLAAMPSVVESWAKPLLAHRANLTATLHMLELARALNIPRFVAASSAAVYGAQDGFAIDESSKPQPQSPYGAQKWMTEQYMELYARERGLSSVALRFFNVFGSRQRPDSPYSGVISIFTDRMSKGLPIKIYGDGTQTRDFVFVQDVARAVASALLAPLASGSFQVFNVASGLSRSLLDLVAILKSHLQWTADVEFLPSREGDIRHSAADTQLAERVLGYKAAVTLEAGLQQLLQSMSQKMGCSTKQKAA